jgi:uncharacterized protein (TIGR02284 family)
MMDDATRQAVDDVLETLEDGAKGFSDAADKLDSSNRPDIADVLRNLGRERRDYHNELQTLASSLGIEPKAKGTVVGAVHRGWMGLKDALSGDDPDGVLDAAEQGEDHALSVYRDVSQRDIANEVLRTVLERQLSGVTAAHNKVKQLRDSVSS